MKIEVDIPESIYDTIQADQMISREQLAVLQMHILNGTPLPTDAVDRVTIKEYLDSYNTVKTEQEPCGDCISREAVMHILDEVGGDFDSPREAVVPIDYIADMVSELPYVTPQPCEDCVSRETVEVAIKHAEINFTVNSDIDFTKHKREVQEIVDGIVDAQIKALKELPPVTPQPKAGHWINIYSDNYKCSECGDWWKGEEITICNYCPNCGAKMESEG